MKDGIKHFSSLQHKAFFQQEPPRAPEASWKASRVASDLALSKELVAKLDAEKGIEGNVLLAEDAADGETSNSKPCQSHFPVWLVVACKPVCVCVSSSPNVAFQTESRVRFCVKGMGTDTDCGLISRIIHPGHLRY